jgi:hypothetical protein
MDQPETIITIIIIFVIISGQKKAFVIIIKISIIVSINISPASEFQSHFA